MSKEGNNKDNIINNKERKIDKSTFREYLESAIVALIISFFVINFVIQAFYIPSGSMLPTLEPGDRIFVNKFIYRFYEPQRQEIIVFKYPVNPKRRFIKRLIGLPGDKVKIIKGTVYVNDNPLEENYTLERSYSDFFLEQLTPDGRVPKGHYFMLGDNRNNSEDSRFWGFVPRENIVGKAFIIFWPLSRIGLIAEGF